MLERAFHFRPICLRNIKISTLLLKKAAAAGLTLVDIGKIMCRPYDDMDHPSLLETIVTRSRGLADMLYDMHDKSRIKE